MILSRLALHLQVAKLPSLAPGAELNKPKKKDYWPEQWKRMQHFTGAQIYETVAGQKLFYQLGFMRGVLISVQVNTTSDFNEAGYAALTKIGDEIIAANVVRQLAAERAPAATMTWNSLKDQRLAASGLPNDRYLVCREARWRQEKIHSYLSVALEWPHVLALEYREETSDD